MVSKKEIKSLIRDCAVYLREEGYSEPRIKDYHRFWRNGIQEYMYKNSLANYHDEIGKKFLNGIPETSGSNMRAIRRSVHVLNDFLLYGKVRKRIVQYVHHELPGELGKVAFEFIDSQERLRYIPSLINKVFTIIKKNLTGFENLLGLVLSDKNPKHNLT